MACFTCGAEWITSTFSSDRRLACSAVMGAWFILYAVVGSQLAWRLSAFVGDPTQPFVWLQPSRDNLYVDLMRAFENASGLQLGVWIAEPCGSPGVSSPGLADYRLGWLSHLE